MLRHSKFLATLLVIIVVGLSSTPAVSQMPETDLSKALKAGARQLSGAEIRALIFGATHYFTSPSVTLGFDYIAEDGTGNTRQTATNGTTTTRPTLAPTEIIGDTICFHFTPENARCGRRLHVVREGNGYAMYVFGTGQRGITITRVVRGNPERL